MDIHHVNGVTEQEEHLTEDARPAELILILQIRPVAPFEHQNLNEVLPGAEVLRHLQLGGHVADLTVSHELAVDEQVEAGIHSLKVHVGRLPLQHGGVDKEGAAVQTAGGMIGNEGGIYGEGVDHVDVVGDIVAPSLHGLPGAGDVDLLAIRSKAICRKVGNIPQGLVEGKIPIAAQSDDSLRPVSVALQGSFFVLIGNEIGTGSLAAHMQGGGILMVVGLENEFVHGDRFLSKRWGNRHL